MPPAATATPCGDDGMSSGSEGDDTGTITLRDNDGGPRTGIGNEITEAFEAHHPDIDMRFVGVPGDLQALDAPWIAQAPPTQAAVEALSDENTTIVDLPYHLPDWNTISKADTEPNFQRLLLGEMSAQEFADDLAERLDGAQAEWQEQRQ
ncbi:hypothetical protein DEH69_24060 [Streptomyces sp. PT12]|nr:hypothetical protein DEH69_24060 [Streptomyces sp. PT12]